MRTIKFTLLIASVALVCFHCDGGKAKPDAWAAMVKNKFVRIGTNAVNIPFEFGLGSDVQGYDVDLGNEIAKDLGYPSKWIKIAEFEEMFSALKNGGIEMIISTVGISDERKQDFAFSDPYYDSGNTIARRRDNMAIKDVASLAGKRVGVQTGRSGDRFMTTQTIAPNVTLAKFPTIDDALSALNLRQLDAVVGDEPIMTYSINKTYSTNLITTGAEVTRFQYAVVVRPDETKLLAKINETIARLKSTNELNATMRDKWFQNVMGDAKKERAAIEKEEELKNQAKMLTVAIVKTSGSTVKLDRLEGFNATLAGPNGTFTSTAIRADEAGLKGDCRFPNPIQPGPYRFILQRASINEAVTIEKKPVTSMTLVVTFSKDGAVITFR